MATRSRIGIENADGTITSIYCHWDGYPDHNGQILIEHYTDEAKIRRLMELGDLSVLGPEIGEKHDFNARADRWCTAYGRDRGEEDVSSMDHEDEAAFLACGEEYNYLFRNGEWFVTTDDGFESVKSVLENLD